MVHYRGPRRFPGCGRRTTDIMGTMSDPTHIECRQIAEMLADYLDGTLDERLRSLVDWHIESCSPCVAFVNTYRGTIKATRQIADVPIPPELKQRLLKVLRTKPS
jgi:anti-sigma factor RsiW